MSLRETHLSTMDAEALAQYNHIHSAATLTFLWESETHKQIGFSILLQPRIFQSLTHTRDVFVLSIRLLGDISSMDDSDLQIAKSKFHERIVSYKPQLGSRILDVAAPEYAVSIHITNALWEGKYYENSHTLSLLIQGLIHSNANNSI